MKARVNFLKDYLDEMKSQMNMFHSVNQDLLRLYEGRKVRVTDGLVLSFKVSFKVFPLH